MGLDGRREIGSFSRNHFGLLTCTYASSVSMELRLSLVAIKSSDGAL